jgi:hypothetical protein
LLGFGYETRIAEQRRLHLVARRTPFGAPVEKRRLVAFLRFSQRVGDIAFAPGDVLRLG